MKPHKPEQEMEIHDDWVTRNSEDIIGFFLWIVCPLIFGILMHMAGIGW